MNLLEHAPRLTAFTCGQSINLIFLDKIQMTQCFQVDHLKLLTQLHMQEGLEEPGGRECRGALWPTVRGECGQDMNHWESRMSLIVSAAVLPGACWASGHGGQRSACCWLCTEFALGSVLVADLQVEWRQSTLFPHMCTRCCWCLKNRSLGTLAQIKMG